jgi:hypothetical protein
MARVGRVIPGVFVTTGNPDEVNDTFPTNTTVGSAYDLRGQLGAILRSNDGSKEWIYAQFSSTSTGKTPAANQPCFWVVNSTANLATPGAWVVDNQTTANTGTAISDVAGILRNACTRGNGVWLLRKSSVSVPVVSTSTVCLAGEAVFASTSSGEAATLSSTSTVAPAAGIGAASWFAGRARLGWVASTATAGAFVGSTATGAIGVNIPVFLDID